MSDLTDRLNAAMRPDDAPIGLESDGWDAGSVTNLESAAWASRKAAEARRRHAEVMAWHRTEQARLDAVVAKEAERHQLDAAFFEGHLAAFLATEIAAGRKTKSLELPGGTIKLTARQPRLDVDSDAFLPWAVQSRPDLVRIKQEVDKAGLKRLATLADDGVVVIDGEIVPGATWEAQADSANIVPAVGEAVS